jgi:CHASE3 domain sensor protein
MDSPSKACEEYSQKLEELSALLEDQGPKIEQIKSLAREIQAVKIKEAAPSQGRVADSPALQAIIKAAKAATEKFGATSPEATVAWAEVEDVAAASSKSNALGGMLGDECLVETIEACDALEELQRAIQVTSSDPAYRA